MSGNLYALLASRFAGARDSVCLQLDDGTRYSYADLDAESARYANLLVSLGLKRGDRVAAQVEKSPQSIFLYLGCLRAGCVYLPLNTAYTLRELDHFFGDATPRLDVRFGVDADRWLVANVTDLRTGRTLMRDQPVVRLL